MTRWLATFVALMMTTGCADPLEREAVEQLRAQLRDPAGSRISKVEMCPREDGMVHGRLNAKNGFGGYVGEVTFFYTPETGPVLPSVTTHRLMREACFGSGASAAGEQ